MQDSVSKEFKLLRVGLDLDDTITEAPRVLCALAEALMLAGHEVHIVTYRPDSSTDEIAADLGELGVPWTRIHHPRGFAKSPAEWKRSIVQDVGLDLLIDDDQDVTAAVGDLAVALRFVGSGRERHESRPRET